MHSDVNAIELAFMGHIERLKAIHGSSNPDDNTARSIRKRQQGQKAVPKPDGKPVALTPEAFDKMFGGRTRRVAAPRRST